jgi:hypothetical protein
MLFLTFAQHYLLWHYTQGLRELLHLYRNFVWFTNRFFSLRELTTSLFAPFKRITEERQERWSFEDLAGRLIINALSRLIGFSIRIVLIIAGLTVLLTISTTLLIVLATWFIAPALIVLGALYGLILMTRF